MSPFSNQEPKDRDWHKRLGAWFDGEGSEMDAKEVRAHLMDSPESRAKLQEWRSLREDLALLQPEEPSADLLARMRARFEDGLADEIYQVSKALRLWNLAAALLLTLGLGMWLTDFLIERATPQDTYASEPGEIDAAIEELLTRPPVSPAESR